MTSNIEKIKALSQELTNYDILSQRENFLLLNGFTDTVIVTDSTGTIKFVNPSCYRMFGYDPDELIGKSLDYLVHQNNNVPNINHENLLKNYQKTKKSVIIGIGRNVIIKDKSGNPVYVHLYVNEFCDSLQKLYVSVIKKL